MLGGMLQHSSMEKRRTTLVLQAELEELKVSAESWRKQVEELKEALAEKDEELKRAVRKRRMRTVAHVDNLALLTSTQVALEDSKLKCAALQEALQKHLQEKEELRWREQLKEDRTKPQRHQLYVIDGGFESELEDQQQSFNQEKEAMRLKLLLQEEQSNRQREEKQHEYEQQLLEKEEWMKQQLLDMEGKFNELLEDVRWQWESRAQKEKELKEKLQESNQLRQEELDKEEKFNELLPDVCRQWESRAQQWAQKEKELKDKLQESNQLRQQELDKYKAEIQKVFEDTIRPEVRRTEYSRWFSQKSRSLSPFSAASRREAEKEEEILLEMEGLEKEDLNNPSCPPSSPHPLPHLHISSSSVSFDTNCTY